MQDGEKRFELFDQKEEKTSCKTIIIATGISKPNDVKFTGKTLTLYFKVTL